MSGKTQSHTATIEDLAHKLTPRLREVRRYLHRHPEVSGQEYRTSEFLANLVKDLDLAPAYAGDKRGVIVDVPADVDVPRFAIRCDIDALPIQTRLRTDYASRVDEVMHACGHDAHASVGWGALAILRDLLEQDSPIGLRVIFQPEEETSRGGPHMIRAGALDNVIGMIALHVDPRTPVGTIAMKDHEFTAGCDTFRCDISGKGGHSARPHLTSDLAGAMGKWITTIYDRVPRCSDSRDSVVVSVGEIECGTAPNIVPDTATLTGTLRSLSLMSSKRAKESMFDVSRAIASIHDCQVKLKFGKHTPPVKNDPSVNAFIREAGSAIVGAKSVRELGKPSMGAEDFAFMANQVPAAMFRLGTAGIEIGHAPLHTPEFDIDEKALPIGASILALSAMNFIGTHT